MLAQIKQKVMDVLNILTTHVLDDKKKVLHSGW